VEWAGRRENEKSNAKCSFLSAASRLASSYFLCSSLANLSHVFEEGKKKQSEQKGRSARFMAEHYKLLLLFIRVCNWMARDEEKLICANKAKMPGYGMSATRHDRPSMATMVGLVSLFAFPQVLSRRAFRGSDVRSRQMESFFTRSD
jgi:hypothetical protein